MKLHRADIYRYCLPLRAPLRLKKYTLSQREGLLLRLETTEGCVAWGEASPLPGFSHEDINDAERALKQVLQLLHEGENLPSWRTAEAWPPSVMCAVDMALLRLHALHAHQPLHRYLSPAAPDAVYLSLLLGDGETECPARLERHRAVKLKVGRRPVAEDAARARTLAATLPEGVSLRIDANRAWDLENAKAFCNATQGLPIEFLEEPLHDPAQLPELVRQTQCRIALDETLAEWASRRRGVPAAYTGDASPGLPETAHPLLRVASALVWKPTLAPFSVQAVQELSACWNVPVILSGAYESGVATTAFAAYAAALAPAAAAGLDTYSSLAADVLTVPLPLTSGQLSLAEALAFNVSPAMLLPVPERP
ncbi:MAG: o-succinylbenzoate synthase [Candidatus Hydrogenedentes bacterium]|nr:o-succinylbenzoate synthase [Candidatus Hydrogenedentota bacterium]